jgi:hypothetical protein
MFVDKSSSKIAEIHGGGGVLGGGSQECCELLISVEELRFEWIKQVCIHFCEGELQGTDFL